MWTTGARRATCGVVCASRTTSVRPLQCRVTQGGPGLARLEELKSTVHAVHALWPAAKAGGCHLAGSGEACAVLLGHFREKGVSLQAGPATSLFRKSLSMSGPFCENRWLSATLESVGLGPGSVTQGCGDCVAMAHHPTWWASKRKCLPPHLNQR